MKILLDKYYDGFESWSDIERDVSEMFEDSGIPGESRGKIIVKIIYVEENEHE